MDKDTTLALCSVVLFAVLGVMVMLTGPDVSKGLMAMALALGGTSQYVGQKDHREGEIVALAGLIFMGASTGWYAAEMVF